MNEKQLKREWSLEEQFAFQGWDFSHLDNRWQTNLLEWDYAWLVKKNLLPTTTLLDMGTGGGEFLLSLGHPYAQTAVTEAWPPNIAVCLKKLAPLGIAVYPVTDHTQLPIPAGSFDLVINRQAVYDLKEVRRVLKPNGLFITQQVGSENCRDLAKFLNPKTTLHTPLFTLATELPKYAAQDFTITYANEGYPELRFFDIGALVFWAKTIKWTFPDFSVDANFTELCQLQTELMHNGFVSTVQHRFVIVAQKLA